MECKSCSIMEYFEGLEDCVGSDYGDKMELYATSLALMEELAAHDCVDYGTSSKILKMVCSGCSACPESALGRSEVSELVKSVGGFMKSAGIRGFRL